MMSIGIYTYSTKPRGSVVHATNLAEALVASGHDATIYALAKPGATLYRPPACAVELIAAEQAPADPDALIRQRIDEFAAGFRRLAMRHDIFHAQDCLAANALLSCRPPASGPIVRTVHHVERFESAYLAECQRRSICEAEAVLSVSRHTQKDVLEQFGRASRLVCNGVPSVRFAARRADGARWLHRRFGVEAGDTVVLSVGGIEPRKNALLSLRAIARAHASHARFRWIIVGDHSVWDHSAYVACFDAELARLSPDLQARIVRAGTLAEEDLTSLYPLSDILLSPSQQEGFGLCVLEAMAAGAAVIAPGRPPFTEYLDGRCAVLVDSSSMESVSKALVALALDPGKRASLASAARERAVHFSWLRSAATHLVHYESVRARRSPASASIRERSTDA